MHIFFLFQVFLFLYDSIITMSIAVQKFVLCEMQRQRKCEIPPADLLSKNQQCHRRLKKRLTTHLDEKQETTAVSHPERPRIKTKKMKLLGARKKNWHEKKNKEPH